MDKSIEFLEKWVPPIIEETEYRLYYTETGDVDFYTCEKPAGKFIIVDLQTYAECRNDLKVINDTLVIPDTNTINISKLVKSDKGVSCHTEDVSIVIQDTTDLPTTFWEIENNELS